MDPTFCLLLNSLNRTANNLVCALPTVLFTMRVVAIVLLAALAVIHAAPTPQLFGNLFGRQNPFFGHRQGSHSPATGVGLGQANGGTFANARGQAQTIPIGPFGGRITLAESTSLAAGIPGLGGRRGGGATAGGVGGGTIGPGGTHVNALSNANAQDGLAFGKAFGLGIDLPLLGVHQTFGQGGGIAFGK